MSTSKEQQSKSIEEMINFYIFKEGMSVTANSISKTNGITLFEARNYLLNFYKRHNKETTGMFMVTLIRDERSLINTLFMEKRLAEVLRDKGKRDKIVDVCIFALVPSKSDISISQILMNRDNVDDIFNIQKLNSSLRSLKLDSRKIGQEMNSEGSKNKENKAIPPKRRMEEEADMNENSLKKKINTKGFSQEDKRSEVKNPHPSPDKKKPAEAKTNTFFKKNSNNSASKSNKTNDISKQKSILNETIQVQSSFETLNSETTLSEEEEEYYLPDKGKEKQKAKAKEVFEPVVEEEHFESIVEEKMQIEEPPITESGNLTVISKEPSSPSLNEAPKPQKAPIEPVQVKKKVRKVKKTRQVFDEATKKRYFEEYWEEEEIEEIVAPVLAKAKPVGNVVNPSPKNKKEKQSDKDNNQKSLMNFFTKKTN